MVSARQKTDEGRARVLQRVKKYQSTAHGQTVIQQYRQTEQYKRDMYERSKRYYADNPEKKSAHDKVYYALKTGKLRKQPCEICGSKFVHAHHDDYAKPLEVRWLCRAHHEEEHHGS